MDWFSDIATAFLALATGFLALAAFKGLYTWRSQKVDTFLEDYATAVFDYTQVVERVLRVLDRIQGLVETEEKREAGESIDDARRRFLTLERYTEGMAESDAKEVESVKEEMEKCIIRIRLLSLLGKRYRLQGYAECQKTIKALRKEFTPSDIALIAAVIRMAVVDKKMALEALKIQMEPRADAIFGNIKPHLSRFDAFVRINSRRLHSGYANRAREWW